LVSVVLDAPAIAVNAIRAAKRSAMVVLTFAAAPMRDADGNVIGAMTISFAIRAARHRVAGDGRI